MTFKQKKVVFCFKLNDSVGVTNCQHGYRFVPL